MQNLNRLVFGFREFLVKFPGIWIRRKRQTKWPPRLPRFTPPGFSVLGLRKGQYLQHFQNRYVRITDAVSNMIAEMIDDK